MTSSVKNITGILCSALLVALGTCCGTNNTGTPTTTGKTETMNSSVRKKIIEYGKNIISVTLDSPSTPNFPETDDPTYTVTKLSDKRYAVSGVVDAQNESGFEARQKWYVEIQLLPEEDFMGVFIRIDGNVLYDDR